LVEIADVLTRLLDDARLVVSARALVAGHDRARLERLDLVERRDPFASLLRIGLTEIEIGERLLRSR
jgi:hypothetical protein